MLEKDNKSGFDHFAGHYSELDGVVFCHGGAGSHETLQRVKAWVKSLVFRVPFHSYKEGSWPQKPLLGRILYIFDHTCPEKNAVFDLQPFYESMEGGCLWIYADSIALPNEALEQEAIDLIPQNLLPSLLELRLGRMRRCILNRYRRFLLLQAVEHSSTSLCICDPSLRDNPIIYANTAFSALTGYPVDEILGSNCRFLQGDEGAQEGVEELRRSMGEKRPCTVLLKNYRKDGSVFWNNLHMAPVLGADGNAAFYVGIQQDVTAEIRSQEELKISEARFRLLADSMPELVWATDQEGTWTFAGRKLKQMLNLENVAEGAGQFARLIQDDRTRQELISNLTGEKRFELSLTLALPTGIRTYSVNGAPWFDTDLSFQGFICCASDVTDLSTSSRILADRNRVLAAQLLIKQKVFRGEPLEVIARETMEVMDSMEAGHSFLIIPDNPMRCCGMTELDAQALMEMLENDDLGLPETSSLVCSTQAVVPEGIDQLREWFGEDEFCFYTWELANGRPAVFGLRRSASLGSWSRSHMDMVRSFGQVFSMAGESRETGKTADLHGDILGQLPLPVAVLSLDGTVTFENAAMRQLKRKHGPRMLKRLVDGCLDEAEIMKTVPGTRSLLKEFGERLWLRLHLIPVEDGTRIVLLAQDVSSQMEMETKVSQYKHIESLGRMRLEVQNEWSNAVGVLKLALNGLRDEIANVETARNFRVLEKVAVSIEGMFRQMQVYTGEGSLSLQNMDLNAWISDKREFMFQIWGSGINFDFILKHGNFLVAMDDPCLTQAMQNLMVLLYPQVDVRKPCFSVTTSSGKTPGTVELSLVVGPAFQDGIPLEFKPHAKSESPSLEISADILKAHGGYLLECRRAGEFHAFQLCLPLAKETRPGDVQDETLPLKLDQSVEVLIIEDNLPLLEIMRNYLETYGCRVQAASHAIEAHAIWSKCRKQIRFCIVDVNLPGGESGVELIRKLRKQNPALPALFTSGFDRREVISRFGLEANDLLLGKPFSRDELVEKLQIVMKRI